MHLISVETPADAQIRSYLLRSGSHHPALGRAPIGMRHLAFLPDSGFQPSSDQAHDLPLSNPAFHQL